MPKAVWRDTVLAEADRALFMDGHYYFPPDSVRWEHLVDSDTTAWCWRRGRARYLSIAVDDEVVPDVGWYYPRPWPPARRLKCHVAFGMGIDLRPGDS